MTVLDTARVDLFGDTSGLRDSFAAAAASVERAGRSITSATARMARSIKVNMDEAGLAAEAVGQALERAGRRLSFALTLPLGGLGAATIVAASRLDRLKRGLDAVSDGADTTDKQLRRLREIAKLPGLGFEEAVRGSINLQAAGFSADLAERALRGFGNALVAVGRGKDDLDGVTFALTQIAAKGKIMGQEINQLAERVPQIRQVMLAAFGTANTEDLQRMGIEATEFVAKVVSELEKMPPVTTGISNAFENIGDQAKMTAAAFGDRLVPATEDALGATTGLLGMLERMPNVLKDLAIGLGVAAAALGPIIFLGGKFISIFARIAQAGAFAAAFGALGSTALAVAGILGGLVVVAIQLTQHWDTLSFEAGRLADILNGRLGPAWEKIGRQMARLRDMVFGVPPAPGTENISQGLLDSLRLQGPPGQARWQIPGFEPPAAEPPPPAWSPRLRIAESIEQQGLLADAIEETAQKLAQLQFDRAFETQEQEAGKLDERIREVTASLAAMNREAERFGGTDAIRRRQAMLTGELIGGPGAGLLPGNQLPSMSRGVRTQWKIVLDPQTGLSDWRRITSGGIPIVMPGGLTPTTGLSGDRSWMTGGAGDPRGGLWDAIKDSFGGIGDRLKSILDPTQIASTVLGNFLTSGLSGAISAIGGMFGKSQGQIERERTLQANTAALERLREGVARLGTSLLGERGSDITGLLEATTTGDLGRMINRGSIDPVFTKNIFQPELQRVLTKLGLSMEDAERIARGYGITLDDTTRSWQALVEAMQSDAIDQLFRSFEGATRLFDIERELFDLSPEQQLQGLVDQLVQFTDIGDEFLQGLDLGTQEGRDALEQFLRDTFEAFRSDPEAFIGSANLDLPISAFLELITSTERLGDTFEGLTETTDAATSAIRNAPAGFRYALAQFRATDPRSIMRDGGALTGAGDFDLGTTDTNGGQRRDFGVRTQAPPKTVTDHTGAIRYVSIETVNLYDVQNPKELLDKLDQEAEWAARTGDATTLQTSANRGSL